MKDFPVNYYVAGIKLLQDSHEQLYVLACFRASSPRTGWWCKQHIEHALQRGLLMQIGKLAHCTNSLSAFLCWCYAFLYFFLSHHWTNWAACTHATNVVFTSKSTEEAGQKCYWDVEESPKRNHRLIALWNTLKPPTHPLESLAVFVVGGVSE